MSGQPAGHKALTKQFKQLQEYVQKNPADVDASQRLTALKEQFELSKAEKKAAEKAAKASKPKAPVNQEVVATSSTPVPTKREQTANKRQGNYEQSLQAVEQARATLNGFMEQREAVFWSQGSSEEALKIARRIQSASEELRAAEAKSEQLLQSFNKANKSVQAAHNKLHQRQKEQAASEIIENGDDTSWANVVKAAGAITAIQHDITLAKTQRPDASKQPDSVTEHDETEPEETYAANLLGDTVCHSIAALVVGVYQEGVNIGVMPDNLQMLARYGITDSISHGIPYVTRPNKMYIPIMLNTSGVLEDCGSEDRDGNMRPPLPAGVEQSKDMGQASAEIPQDKKKWVGMTGHWVLAVATREVATVSIKFFNSLAYRSGNTFNASKGAVRRIARNIIRHSGWMGSSTPQFGRETFVECSPQGWMNTCGTHVVYSAWADILGFEAMAGNASASDIEAWLVGHGWVIPRDQQPEAGSELAKILQAKTSPMNQNLLGLHVANEIVAATSAASAGDISMVDTSTFNPSTTKPSTTTLSTSKPSTVDTSTAAPVTLKLSLKQPEPQPRRTGAVRPPGFKILS
ncbi:MAG: hypothetical protein Q9213_004240 [Squamulea squamosa]